jgi:uncharacterized membrane protein YgaE (UPF0421/DUF939 family)
VDVRARLERARSRLGLPVLGRLAQTALAAGIAWELALQLPNHGQPFFAPIAAAIALGAAVGRRGRQAIEMVTGVAAGILMGAAVLALVGAGAWQLVVVTFVALLLTTAVGASPVVRNQAAASAILVVALHRPGSNLALQRLEDALIGGAIAVLMARVLFPVHPVELVRDEARALRERLADALDEVAAALADRDRERAEAALDRIDEVDEHALAEAVVLARQVTRAAPRRRRLRRRIDALGAVYRELEASVLDAHAVATGGLRLVSGDTAAAAVAADAVRAAAASIRAVDPTDARAAADRARRAANRLLNADSSLGSGVVAHAVASIADHTLRAAEGREEERKLADAERPTAVERLRVRG